MDIILYRLKLNQLKEKIGSVVDICDKYNDEEHADRLKKLQKAIGEDAFQLIVVGEFSRGKSTLVNALLGDEILPSSTEPTTAMLNVIKNGDSTAQYFIHYNDDSTKEVDSTEFLSMVAQNTSDGKSQEEIIKDVYSDAANFGRIRNAEIRVKNDFGKIGVDIVDTPGLNDVNTAREEITLQYIPRSDAAIVVCSADEPLAASELAFIKEQLIGQQITKLFIAVNRADCLRTEQARADIREYFENNLEGIVEKERIFLVSGAKALKYKLQQKGIKYKHPVETYEETGFASFEKSVLNYLANDRGVIKLQRYCALFMEIINEIIYGTLENRRNAMMLSKQDLETQIAELKEKADQLEKRYKNELEKAATELLTKKSAFAKDYEKILSQMGNAALNSVMRYRGNDMEEMCGLISSSVMPFRRKIKDEFMQSVEDAVLNTISMHTDGFGEEFSEIGIPKNVLKISIGNDNDELQVYSQDQMMAMGQPSENAGGSDGSDFLIGAAVGVGLLALGALCFTHPVLFLGARVVAKLVASSGNSNNQQAIETSETQNTQSSVQMVVSNAMVKKVYSAEVKKCYISNVPAKVSAFKDEYERNIHLVIERLEKDCRIQMDSYRRQFELELDSKTDEGVQINDRLDEVRANSNKLTDINLWCGGFA